MTAAEIVAACNARFSANDTVTPSKNRSSSFVSKGQEFTAIKVGPEPTQSEAGRAWFDAFVDQVLPEPARGVGKMLIWRELPRVSRADPKKHVGMAPGWYVFGRVGVVDMMA